jgi:hypothetical protein
MKLGRSFNATLGSGALCATKQTVTVRFTPTHAVPEPLSLSLVGAGLVAPALAPLSGHAIPALRITARLDARPHKPGNARAAITRHVLNNEKETTT